MAAPAGRDTPPSTVESTVVEEGILDLKLSQLASCSRCWCQIRATEFLWSDKSGAARDSLLPITGVRQLYDLPVMSKDSTMHNPFDRHDLLLTGRLRSSGEITSFKVRVPYPSMRFRWVAALNSARTGHAGRRQYKHKSRSFLSYHSAVDRVISSPKFRETLRRGVKDSPWVSYLDVRTMATYYVNRVTKETTWIKPEAESQDNNESIDLNKTTADRRDPHLTSEPRQLLARMNERLDVMTRWLMQQTIAQEFDTLILLAKHGALTAAKTDGDPMSTFGSTTFLGSFYRNILSCPLFDQSTQEGKRRLRRIFSDFIELLPEFNTRYAAAHNDPTGIRKDVLRITANPVYHMSRTTWKHFDEGGPQKISPEFHSNVDLDDRVDDMLDQKLIARAILNVLAECFWFDTQDEVSSAANGVDRLLGAFVVANNVNELPDTWQQLLHAMAPTILFRIWQSLEKPLSASSFTNVYNSLPRSAIIEAIRWKLVDGGVAGSVIKLLLKTRIAGSPTPFQQLVSAQLGIQEHDRAILYWSEYLQPAVKRRLDKERCKGGVLHPASFEDGTQGLRDFMIALKSGYRQGFMMQDLSRDWQKDGSYTSPEEQSRMQSQALQEILENELAKVEKAGLVELYGDEKFIALVELVLIVIIEPFAELLCRPEVGAADVLDDVFRAWKRVIDVGGFCSNGESALEPVSKLKGYADAIDELQTSIFRLIKQAVIFDYHKWRDVLQWASELLSNSKLDLGVQEIIAGSPIRRRQRPPPPPPPPTNKNSTSSEKETFGGLDSKLQATVWGEVDSLLEQCSQGRATYQAGVLTEARLEISEKKVLPLFIERTSELLSRRDIQLQKLAAMGRGGAVRSHRRGSSPEPYKRSKDETGIDVEHVHNTEEYALWYISAVKNSMPEQKNISTSNGSIIRSAGVHVALLALHGFERCDVEQVNVSQSSVGEQLNEFMSNLNDALLGNTSTDKKGKYEELSSYRGELSKYISLWTLAGPRPKGSSHLHPIEDIRLAGNPEEEDSMHLQLSGYSMLEVPLTDSGLRLWYRRGTTKPPIKALHIGGLPLCDMANDALNSMASVNKSNAKGWSSFMNRITFIGANIRTMEVLLPPRKSRTARTDAGEDCGRDIAGDKYESWQDGGVENSHGNQLAAVRLVICR